MKAIDFSQRHDEIPQAEAGTQHFAERAAIEDSPRVIQALERGERAAEIAKLAVVVVLDDPCSCLGGPRQQFKSAGT